MLWWGMLWWGWGVVGKVGACATMGICQRTPHKFKLRAPSFFWE